MIFVTVHFDCFALLLAWFALMGTLSWRKSWRQVILLTSRIYIPYLLFQTKFLCRHLHCTLCNFCGRLDVKRQNTGVTGNLTAYRWTADRTAGPNSLPLLNFKRTNNNGNWDVLNNQYQRLHFKKQKKLGRLVRHQFMRHSKQLTIKDSTVFQCLLFNQKLFFHKKIIVSMKFRSDSRFFRSGTFIPSTYCND